MTDRETEWSALLRAANAGDGRAYGRFLHEITPVLRGLLRSRGRALVADAHEDVLQEVLLAIHAKRHTWREDAPLLPWLYAIARYKLADAFAGAERQFTCRSRICRASSRPRRMTPRPPVTAQC